MIENGSLMAKKKMGLSLKLISTLRSMLLSIKTTVRKKIDYEMETSLVLPIIDISSPDKISTAQLIRKVRLHHLISLSLSSVSARVETLLLLYYIQIALLGDQKIFA